jgi:hypothetical protein
MLRSVIGVENGNSGREDKASISFWVLLAIVLAVWAAWTLVFYRTSRDTALIDVITRQHRYLLKGSILELLVERLSEEVSAMMRSRFTFAQEQPIILPASGRTSNSRHWGGSTVAVQGAN